ncbi:MAG: DUF4282 domain-containing protein [Betaproteobacteria bacterium]|nr:DUF4282 domain-containing protein [Betaproteobacteria bacterium]
MNNILKELFKFDTMVTPKVITVVYLLLLLLVAFGALGTMVIMAAGGFAFGFVSGIAASLAGLIVAVLIIAIGGLSVRMYCELLIVLFKMNEALQEIRRKKAEQEQKRQELEQKLGKPPSATADS